MAVKAVNAAAADLERTDLHALGHAQSARTLWAEQSLVAGKTQNRNVLLFHVDGQYTG